MSRDVRARLAEAARAELACGTAWYIPTGESIADALMPVVEQYAAERAAEALRAAAQEAVDSGYILRLDSGVMFDVLTDRQLRDRADALNASEPDLTIQVHQTGLENGSAPA